ncbi:putative plastid-lipid-associated protein 13, chloroplastic [Vitis vinifera]|uniref:Putative plastid-lipid-associated protein 13, chloroplastic n=1 Tax=Vitis vinifera TaxID=29760 RepID=A0A438D5G5_VITVI|nr:putative plastid-lipid-associated protein 13, chloroplastic [Vitis vinifera]
MISCVRQHSAPYRSKEIRLTPFGQIENSFFVSFCFCAAGEWPESIGRPKIWSDLRSSSLQSDGPAGRTGAPATYAKEMERLSAKESLLLAFKDSGGFEALVTGKTTEMQSIDVNERITGLERLNPTPRPTTSPYLEGQWNLEWFGTGKPGSLAARIFPSALAHLSKVDVVIKDSYGKTTVNLKLLNSVVEESVPEQLKGAFGQAVSTAQQLPVPVKDAISSGLKIPLNGRFQRMLMISYLDEEILILRDTTGIPEVLSRLDVPPSTMAEPATEYES